MASMLPDNRRPTRPYWDLLEFGLAAAGAVVCVFVCVVLARLVIGP